mmetsp:Transcript_54573/g.86753  ORF Transcript_54573/g.86753 Transcript_54573/m.86753 type:complete len:224 (+) Transcript_54573:413-1084(+)
MAPSLPAHHLETRSRWDPPDPPGSALHRCPHSPGPASPRSCPTSSPAIPPRESYSPWLSATSPPRPVASPAWRCSPLSGAPAGAGSDSRGSAARSKSQELCPNLLIVLRRSQPLARRTQCPHIQRAHRGMASNKSQPPISKKVLLRRTDIWPPTGLGNAPLQPVLPIFFVHNSQNHLQAAQSPRVVPLDMCSATTLPHQQGYPHPSVLRGVPRRQRDVRSDPR